MIVLCAVCFQGLDAVMRDSLNGGIFVLLGVTGVVLAAFGTFFVQIARRARAAGEPEPPFDQVPLLPPQKGATGR